MERGNLRCDANVSLRPRGQEKLGTRTETKNVNSMRSVERAVRYEIQRQAAILAAGGTITQETRHWHEDTGTTSPGRPKSDADDYRYFPEPDLLPVAPSPRADRGAARRAARAAGRSPPPAEGRLGLHRPGVPGRRQRRPARRGRGDRRRRRGPGGRAQVVDRRDRPHRERPGARGVRPRSRRRMSRRCRRSSTPARSTTSWRARCSRASSRARAPRRRSSTPAVSRSSRTTARSSPRSTRRSPSQPDVLAKIRDGKVQAAGAVIGAVMKAMKGQADAARVRELSWSAPRSSSLAPRAGRLRSSRPWSCPPRVAGCRRLRENRAWDAATDRAGSSRRRVPTTPAPASCMSTWTRSTHPSSSSTTRRCGASPIIVGGAREPRRRLERVVRGAPVRRALGDAGRSGAAALPDGDRGRRRTSTAISRCPRR